MCASMSNDGTNHGMYIWRDPNLAGHPIIETDLDDLISFAQQHGVERILYDNWGTGLSQENDSDWSLGTGRQPDWFLNDFISKAHDKCIKVEALYTDHLRFQNVLDYNLANQNKFDAIRMNYEEEWNLGGDPNLRDTEPVSADDIRYFETAKNKTRGSVPGWLRNNARWWADGQISDDDYLAGIQYLLDVGIIGMGLPLFASISWHWGRPDTDPLDQPIMYDGNERFAYEHILDIVDGVDIQTAWAGDDAGTVIPERTKPIIEYARSLDKPAWITLETSDRLSGNGTFNGQTIQNIENMAQNILENLGNDDCMPAGIIYHFYMNSYG